MGPVAMIPLSTPAPWLHLPSLFSKEDGKEIYIWQSLLSARYCLWSPQHPHKVTVTAPTWQVCKLEVRVLKGLTAPEVVSHLSSKPHVVPALGTQVDDQHHVALMHVCTDAATQAPSALA